MSDLALATAIFAITYAVIVSEKVHKTVAALAGGAIVIVTGVLDQEEAFAAIDFNVIFLLMGMMVIANIAGKTGLFQWLAVRSAKLVGARPLYILAILCTLTAVLSAFLDNVTTVVLMAPLTLFIARNLELDPRPFLISEIMASNIGGAATLIGDPPNIIIGSAADLDYVSFLVHLAPVSIIIFFVFLGMVLFLFRGQLQARPEHQRRILAMDESQLLTDRRLLKIVVAILILTIIGFLIHGALDYEAATVALLGAAVLLILSGESPHDALREVEWTTLIFFVGLFMVVGGVEEAGLLERIGQRIADITAGNATTATMLLLWASGFLSGIVDNVPYAAAMVPVVEELGGQVHSSGAADNVLWWALALGAGLGGNFTIVAAAANVFIVNTAERAGYKISFVEYLRYGAMISFVSLSIATLYLWARYLL